MPKLFGTDGVRGIVGEDLSGELVFKLGRAGAVFLTGSARPAPQLRGGARPGRSSKKGQIVVGKDTRASGDFLEAALSAGILSAGADVLKVGVMPTAAIAYLTQVLKAEGGVVISASHNPAEYNGIKFFNHQGFKLSESEEEKIEEYLEKVSFEKGLRKVGQIEEVKGAEQIYLKFLKENSSGDFSGFKIALDCANGASYKLSPLLFRELKAEVLAFGVSPNGFNINQGCGSTYPKFLQEIVKKSSVNLGLSYDGDADRVITIDEKGEIVDGDYLLAILALHFKKKGELLNDAIVTTVMTNMGFDLALEKEGFKVIKTKVGDRYVLEDMLKHQAELGGEQSGHIIFLKHSSTGDGLLTSIKLLSVLKETGKPLSVLKKVMTHFPQVLLNIPVKNKGSLGGSKKVWAGVSRAEKELKDQGRILVRPSGTEELIRVMVEAREKSQAQEIAQGIARIIKEELS